MDGTLRFSAVFLQAEGEQATGIEVPPEVREALGAGRRPAVRVVLDGHELRTTVGSMGGAKAPETRARRIDEAVSLFLAGTPR